MSKIKSIKLLLFIIFDSVDSVNRRIVIHEQVFLSFKIPDNYWPEVLFFLGCQCTWQS